MKLITFPKQSRSVKFKHLTLITVKILTHNFSGPYFSEFLQNLIFDNAELYDVLISTFWKQQYSLAHLISWIYGLMIIFGLCCNEKILDFWKDHAQNFFVVISNFFA